MFIVLGLLGCSPGPKIKTVPVSGTVKYKGQPVVGAIVTFLKTADGGRNAGGLTDSEGKFTLETQIGGAKSQNGAVEGSYTVTVATAATPERPFGTPGPGVDPSQVSADQMKAMGEKMMAPQEQSQGAVDPTFQKKAALEQAKSSLPAKYAEAESSPLKDYAVKAGEKSPIHFDLELTDD
ncbi:MAG TPA: carboxypeptidase-like regulatory domain-containing protein [Pirellulales bacterium]|nr:carboxypeptidase-like regulatory domain-containing protein [Pirellulales bacterium]